MAAAVCGNTGNIEQHIRTTATTKRVRPGELFLDYDKLRSGFVTHTQFFRVLHQNLGIKLSEQEQEELRKKYELGKNGQMNYRIFCDAVYPRFDPNNLGNDPREQTIEPREFLGTERSLQRLAPEEEEKIENLLLSLSQYYKYRGINLRTCCEDFDRHHLGVIQESQFYRSFPRPPEVGEENVHLLLMKYRDPNRQKMVNYLNMHHDLEAIGQRIQQEDIQSQTSQANISDFLPLQPGADQTLQEIFDRIRIAVYKNRVRTIEFFKDYDKLRSGIITENQFICGLSLAIGKEAQLARPEIQKIVEFYRTPDDRVRYKEFCDMMENAFNIPDLEKKPTQDVVRPPDGVLGRNLPRLTDSEEERLGEVIGRLSDQARKRRLMMYQYFKDYDRSQGYSRVITGTQFGRILHFLSLNVAPEDFNLLLRKFADPETGDVNYPAFVQCVDKEFVNYTQEIQKDEKRAQSASPSVSRTTRRTTDISLDDLMARVCHHALTNRRRVCEFFKDFDPLRSGTITKSQFRRGLSDFGLSALGQHNLDDQQYDMLSRAYQHPDKSDKVLWTHFTQDVESAFTQPHLEKNPTQKVPPQEIYHVPKPGTMDWSYASEDHRNFVEEIMHRLRQRASQRRVLAKPVFQDFDRHNNGHVTVSQFRQCLTMLELNCTDPEMQALEAKFCNDTGFNYIKFLEELEPQEPPKQMYIERLKEVRLANQKQAQVSNGNVNTDLDGVLVKIKTKVYKERVRIHEWLRDYDKLRSGRMKTNSFRRALDLCGFQLTESELAILEDHYASPGHSGHVDHVRFSDDIESIFTTKNLEKNPLLDVEQFKPPVEWKQNQIQPEMENVLSTCMSRLAEKVRKNRIQLFPLFKDYDRVNNGTVSRSQFRRVLNELELASLVATEQEWVCLYQKFDVKVGGKDDVNYIGFCDRIHEIESQWMKH